MLKISFSEAMETLKNGKTIYLQREDLQHDNFNIPFKKDEYEDMFALEGFSFKDLYEGTWLIENEDKAGETE